MNKIKKRLIIKIEIGILLSFISFLIFTLNDNHFPTTDSIPNNLTAVNIVHNNRFDLTNFKDDLIKKDLIGISAENKNNNKIYTKTPILNGILPVPFFYLSDKYYGVKNPTNEFILNTDYYQIIGKRFASLISAISVFFVFIFLYNFSNSIKFSILGSIVFSFGSFVLSTSSQGNWQHASSLLFITIGFIYFQKFFQKPKNMNLIISTLSLLISYFIRPVNVVFPISILIILIVYKKYKNIPIFFTTMFIMYVLNGYLNKIIGIPNGYSNEIVRSFIEINIGNALKAFVSILFSPNSGIFSYYPVFIFSFAGFFYIIKHIKNVIKDVNFPIILFSLINILFIFGLNSIWWCWTGGTSWGPRLLTESTLPLIILMMFYLLDNKEHFLLKRIIFIILLGFTVINSLVCIYCNNTEWNSKYWSNKTMLEGAWQYNPTMINYYLFQKRSFFVNKLYFSKNEIMFNTKTYLIHVPDKTIKLIFDNSTVYSPIN